MNTFLTDIIPAKMRKYFYASYGMVAVVLGALQIAEVNTGKASEVLVYVGIALGFTAASNARSADGDLK